MQTILEVLFSKQDAGYADFQAKLTPTVPRERFIGVRVPQLRTLARQLYGTDTAHRFLQTLPHHYYEENLLHALLLNREKDRQRLYEELERFLPYVDNWAVCDSLLPTCFRKEKQELLKKIRLWLSSDHIYTCRFGLSMLMRHFLDEDCRAEHLSLAASVRPGEYYIQMMQAWFFATALAKQWDLALPYLMEHRLSDWVHHKAIQKAVESRRITSEQKDTLRTLR